MDILKKPWKLILVLFLAMLPAATLVDAAQQRVYKVAIDAEYAPYEFRDIDGQVKGMLPDMLRAIGKAEGVTFEFLPMAWPDAVNSLKNGKVDLLNMIRTPARIGKYEFSNPHSVIVQALFRNKQHDDINSLEDIDGSVIALQQYDIAKEKLAERNDFDAVMVNSKEQGFLGLNSGKVAGFFAAEQPGLYFLKEHEMKNIELAILDLWPQDFCFTAKKGNTAIIALLNTGLAKLKQSGRHTNIVSQWTIKPDSWMKRHATEVMATIGILLLMAVSLWLWVFLLRRTVRQRSSELAQEHERLQLSEETHRGLLDTMPGALLLIQDGLIVYTNPAALSMFGMRDADAQLPFMTYVPERCADVISEQMTQIVTAKQAVSAQEGKLMREDHSEFDAEVTATPCEYQGRPAVQLIIFDISARKQAESEIARLNDAVEHANDVIFHLDVEGKIRAINQAGLRLIGLAMEEVIGQPFITFTLPESLPLAQEMFARKMHGDMEESRYELNVKNSRGDSAIMEIDTRALIEDGHFAGVYGIARDITDRKRAEQKVQQQIERMHELRRALESLNRAGSLEEVWQAAVVGMMGVMGSDRASVLLFGPDDDSDDKAHFVAWQGLSEHYRQAVDGHCPWQQHETGAEPIYMPHIASEDLPDDLRTVILAEGIRACAFFPLIGKDGVIGKFMVYFNQVHAFSLEDMNFGRILADDLVATINRLEAEQEKAAIQQQAEHTQRLESLGVLAGGIAHDFNNILTAIMGNAAIAERKAISHPQDMPKYLSNIVESSENAADLCKQMLAYSGKGKFVVQAIDLSGMVDKITKLLEISISKNVVLKYQLAEHLPAVDADIAQIQQVIMNLVINASDAIGSRSGVVSIGTGVMYADRAYLKETCIDSDIPEGRYVFLEVSDTGCGMDKQTMQRIFEPFFTTKFTGRGLGMSAVLGIVRGHHGTLKLYSELKRGTTFKMLLPVSDASAESIEKKTAAISQLQGSGTILIVDDEETIRETAAMMLEDMGFTALTAVNGLDGVEVYRQHQDEIVGVLLDMTMPKMDGKACFRELRRINKDVRVILSSGYNEQEATSHFTGQGLAGFVQKPYRPEVLEKTMRQIIARQGPG